MTRLSKAKRDQLILALVVVTAVVAGLFFGLIRMQQRSLGELKGRRQTVQTKLTDIQKTTQNAARIESALADAKAKLSIHEKNIASGDLLLWVFNLVRDFKKPYDVDVPQFGSIIIENSTVSAQFPYKQFHLTLSGTAHYFDLGRFIADFENRYPEIRLENLELQPAPSAGGSAPSEMLLFRMDLVGLIKPDSSS
jgi:Tfp pilus assembly protein PilO